LNLLKPSIALAVTALCASSINLHAASGQHPSARPPLVLAGSTPLPEITGGDFDHFAVDLAHNRLYVSAEVYGSIEVFNLKSGEHLLSAKGVVKSPHKLLYLPDKNQLFVADAGDASCKILDATDLHLIKSISLEFDPDAGVYDPSSRIFYVGNGGLKARSNISYINEISVDRQQVIGRIPLFAGTLKTMLIDHDANLLYVNMRDVKQVGVIDLKTKTVVHSWTAPEFNLNSAMALDTAHHRLFIGSRKPGKLVVLDSTNGQVVTTIPIVDVSDDMTFDAPHSVLYISGAEGVDVLHQDNVDHYRTVQHVDTLGGKTSVYVPSLKRFYVVHTKGEQAQQAGLQIFKVSNRGS
jgi:DNA-binding beta-propeller fold protein YncE